MTYKQAVEEVKQYEYLVGQSIDGEYEISNLVIVPSSRQFDSEIANRIYLDKPYHDILSAHNEFTVMVLYDLYSYAATGVLFKGNLNDVIHKLK